MVLSKCPMQRLTHEHVWSIGKESRARSVLSKNSHSRPQGPGQDLAPDPTGPRQGFTPERRGHRQGFIQGAQGLTAKPAAS